LSHGGQTVILNKVKVINGSVVGKWRRSSASKVVATISQKTVPTNQRQKIGITTAAGIARAVKRDPRGSKLAIFPETLRKVIGSRKGFDGINLAPEEISVCLE